jgi:hypothetical protein
MAARFFAATVLIMVCTWLSGCSGTVSQKKDTPPQPKVLEEDISDQRPISPETERQTSGPAVTGPAPYLEGVPSGVDPGSRRPKRIKWRDRPGSEKGWEAAPDRSADM